MAFGKADKIEKVKPKKDKKIFTLFLVVIFSLLIAMTRAIETTLVAMIFQIILIFTQIVVVKALIETYMGEEE